VGICSLAINAVEKVESCRDIEPNVKEGEIEHYPEQINGC
jgi:hypothetical protein